VNITHRNNHLMLQQKADGTGNTISFLLDAEYSDLFFVLKLDEYTWLRNLKNGSDFCIPLTRVERRGSTQVEVQKVDDKSSQPDGLISDIRNLTVGLSSRRGQRAKNKVLQEDILQEIERLAAEAYSIFRSPTIDTVEESVYHDDPASAKPACSGTGSGFEILCQGFNWESHKSGKWYIELGTKAMELASLGFTIIWSPPPTDSVSPEGYMPRDLYNLNSRYTLFTLIFFLEDLIKGNTMVLTSSHALVIGWLVLLQDSSKLTVVKRS
jgi:alpha-amylase